MTIFPLPIFQLFFINQLMHHYRHFSLFPSQTIHHSFVLPSFNRSINLGLAWIGDAWVIPSPRPHLAFAGKTSDVFYCFTKPFSKQNTSTIMLLFAFRGTFFFFFFLFGVRGWKTSSEKTGPFQTFFHSCFPRESLSA